MINDIKRGPIANSLVLHDFKMNPIDMKNLFYYIENWFSSKNNVIPNKMSISGNSGVRSGSKTITFRNGKQRLEKFQFDGVNGMWIAALPPEVGTEMFDFVCDMNLHQGPNGRSTFSLCWDDQIIKFGRQYFEDLAQDLYAFLEPAYGYGYQRLFKLGPSFYPYGILAGIDSFSQEADQITKWGDEYCYDSGRYRTGLLRDVYPINFLSHEHFVENIDGQTLKSWIESSSEHGELRQLAENLWSWWMPEENIAVVRERLIPAGLLLSY